MFFVENLKFRPFMPTVLSFPVKYSSESQMQSNHRNAYWFTNSQFTFMSYCNVSWINIQSSSFKILLLQKFNSNIRKKRANLSGIFWGFCLCFLEILQFLTSVNPFKILQTWTAAAALFRLKCWDQKCGNLRECCCCFHLGKIASPFLKKDSGMSKNSIMIYTIEKVSWDPWKTSTKRGQSALWCFFAIFTNDEGSIESILNQKQKNVSRIPNLQERNP